MPGRNQWIRCINDGVGGGLLAPQRRLWPLSPLRETERTFLLSSPSFVTPWSSYPPPISLFLAMCLASLSSPLNLSASSWPFGLWLTPCCFSCFSGSLLWSPLTWWTWGDTSVWSHHRLFRELQVAVCMECVNCRQKNCSSPCTVTHFIWIHIFRMIRSWHILNVASSSGGGRERWEMNSGKRGGLPWAFHGEETGTLSV